MALISSQDKEISVRADVRLNRLYTTLRGELSAKDLAALPEELRREARKLLPGYIAISNIKDFRPASAAVEQVLSESMKAAVETGVGPVIRVVSPEKKYTLQEISQKEHNYQAIICSSLEEAEAKARQIEKSEAGQ